MAISHQQVYENIATMLEAGVDLKKTLHTSVKSADRELHDAVISVEKSVRKGGTLISAFSRYPKIFPVFDRALIDAGEKSGRLPVCHTVLIWSNSAVFHPRCCSVHYTFSNYPYIHREIYILCYLITHGLFWPAGLPCNSLPEIT